MGKMVRLFTCLLSIFFIFFASVPVSYASFEKNPLQFELTELKFATSQDGSHYATGYMRWGNVSPYELLDLSGKLDLYNNKGEKINIDSDVDYFSSPVMHPGDNELGITELLTFDLVPSVTKASDLTGAYLKPTYTYTLGKKAEPRPYIYTKMTAYEFTDTHYIAHMILVNRGEATAEKFIYSGVEAIDYRQDGLFYPENSHPVINESFRLEPGQFARTSFKIPINYLKTKYTDLYQVRADIRFKYKATAPYQESALNVTANNQKLVNQTFTENDITYVSLRELVEALDGTIQWDDPTQTATIIRGPSTVTIPVGSNKFLRDGIEFTASANAKLYNNTILVVPLRDVAELLNCDIYFDHKWGQKSIIVIPVPLHT
ncbi:copper amine oxidase N-terminal domain-containing protein [Brevibacillus fortis]|uniref:copper amine oxidase N-terminal domain-containing protein n=1 Tax=Brevibacillus fortis TaxID=2126352 RepID=UPI0038FC3EBA